MHNFTLQIRQVYAFRQRVSYGSTVIGSTKIRIIYKYLFFKYRRLLYGSYADSCDINISLFLHQRTGAYIVLPVIYRFYP
jgi:hypothetical protein